MGVGRLIHVPNSFEIRERLSKNNINADIWWELNKQQNNKLLEEFISLGKQEICNKQFNYNVFLKIYEKKVARYCKDIKMKYPKLILKP